MVDADRFKNAASYTMTDLWTDKQTDNSSGVFSVKDLEAYDNITIRVSAN